MKVFLPPKLEVRGDTVCVNTVGGRHAPQAGRPWRSVTHGAMCRAGHSSDEWQRAEQAGG